MSFQPLTLNNISDFSGSEHHRKLQGLFNTKLKYKYITKLLLSLHILIQERYILCVLSAP